MISDRGSAPRTHFFSLGIEHCTGFGALQRKPLLSSTVDSFQANALACLCVVDSLGVLFSQPQQQLKHNRSLRKAFVHADDLHVRSILVPHVPNHMYEGEDFST